MAADIPSESVRSLARRLLAAEALCPPAPDQHLHEAVRVCDKLRLSLTRFAGADGFASLLARSLALARVEVPSLNRITVKPDCCVGFPVYWKVLSSRSATSCSSSATPSVTRAEPTLVYAERCVQSL